MRHSITSFLLIMSLGSCNNPYDAERVARSYCECLKSNNAVEDFDRAHKTCGERFIKQNRYFKLWAVDMQDHELDNKISNETRDSLQSFMLTFNKYTNDHCCQETLACRDSMQSK